MSKTESLADQLRKRIMGGEWQRGDLLPTQAELMATYRVSRTTVHRALDSLAEEGLVETRQGGPAIVADPDPKPWLVLEFPEADRLGERPLLFEPDPWASLRRECEQRMVSVWKQLAELFEFDVDDDVVERTIRLFAGDTLLVTARSYAPAELADDADGWQHVDVRRLALPGHAATSRYVVNRPRTLTPAEREDLAVPRGVSVNVTARPYDVLAGDRLLRAGLILVARGDLVVVRNFLPDPGNWPHS